MALAKVKLIVFLKGELILNLPWASESRRTEEEKCLTGSGGE